MLILVGFRHEDQPSRKRNRYRLIFVVPKCHAQRHIISTANMLDGIGTVITSDGSIYANAIWKPERGTLWCTGDLPKTGNMTHFGLQSPVIFRGGFLIFTTDRKSTRLNSSH